MYSIVNSAIKAAGDPQLTRGFAFLEPPDHKPNLDPTPNSSTSWRVVRKLEIGE
jgi:hypothetical protein